MRLFIAIKLKDDLKSHLHKIQSSIIKNEKITPASDFHITIKFLGEISPDKLEKIKLRLNKIKFNKFKFSLSHIDFFPDEKNIRVIWVGVRPFAKILELQNKIDEKLFELGIAKEKNFHPHITLGRVNFIKDKNQFMDTLDQIKVERLSMTVKSINLIKSTLTPTGSIHETILTVER